VKIITLEKQEFDQFAKNHKYESYFQTSNYAEVELSGNYQVHYLGFLDDEENLIGGAMCLYKELFWNYSYAYVPRGLLIDYDDPKLVQRITTKLKKLLNKQKFIFIKIDPPVIVSERDLDGKILYNSDTANEILNTLENNSYKHMGFNLYYETRLPRWNAIIKLNKDTKTMYNNFSKTIKENIKEAEQNAIEIIEDNSGDINTFYEMIKQAYGRFGKRYFENLYNSFKNNNDITIFYATLNTSKFVKNSNTLYNIEEEKNRSLANIISGSETHKYNIEKVINDKIISDKNLHRYKKNVVSATNLLKKYPNGKNLAVSLVIKHKKGADCLILHEGKELTEYKASSLLVYEMCKKYAEMDLKYLTLCPAIGNFDKKTPFYKKISSFIGFNPTIIEYIGEFDLIINPLMYKIYLNKQAKKKKVKK